MHSSSPPFVLHALPILILLDLIILIILGEEHKSWDSVAKCKYCWSDSNKSELHSQRQQEQIKFKECFPALSLESFVFLSPIQRTKKILKSIYDTDCMEPTTVAQPLKKFPEFCGTRKFIIVFTIVRH
jgi:hypothetical protein